MLRDLLRIQFDQESGELRVDALDGFAVYPQVERPQILRDISLAIERIAANMEGDTSGPIPVIDYSDQGPEPTKH